MGSPAHAARRTRRLALVAAALAAGLAGVPAAAMAAPAPAVLPSDPLYADQSALQPGAAIGAPEAWKVATGAGVVVAVLDTGVDASHADLKGALWTNPGEVAGNGRDDDGNGYVDDVHGVDLVNDDGDPADDEGHGTHIAGIIAARADGEGAVGLAPDAQVMPVKVLDARRGGRTDVVADGIEYALAHGADVINLSLNGAGADPRLRAAIRAAGTAGVTVVASAGNDGVDLGLTPSYPASYGDPAVLTVGATDGDSILAAFSNFGRGVALTAPGVDILSTSSTGGYELRSGTSMAAPEVAAGLALLHSARPDLPDAELRDALTAGALRPPGLLGRIGGGALDVAAALHRVVPADRWPTRADPPVLTAKVKKRSARSGRRARTLITWQLTGDRSRVARFRITLGGKVLARRSTADARGAWVARRSGRVTVTALTAAGVRVAAARVALK